MKARIVLLSAVALAACRPEFAPDEGLITHPRILAVKSEPAEAKPGTQLTYTALLADPSGTSDASATSWNFCTAPKPPTENNVVSSECLDDSSLIRAGNGISIVAATPRDSCSLFGPDTPPGGFRPRDPDVTGGYYQPLRIDLEDADPTFHLQRILCGLGGAPADLAREFGLAYAPNQNPHLAPITASVDGHAVSLDAIPHGARVELSASWSADDAESYAYFDRTAQTISTNRESMRVAWYVSAGRLDTQSSGRGESDPTLGTSNGWTAPNASGHVALWLVLRDARGGTDFAAYDLVVSP